MSNDGQKPQGSVPPRPGWANGFRSFRTISRIVSAGASTVASTVRSAASAASLIVDREDSAVQDQVYWAGFDKLECDENITRKVLLLGCRSGFQVWDVEDADNVRDLVSRHDGPVCFLQMLPKPIISKRAEDNFVDSRPLLVTCADGSVAGSVDSQEGLANPCNGTAATSHGIGNGSFLPSLVRFYSLRSQSYVHVLKFRSLVCSVRCSARVVAVALPAQIHCFDAATLERDYTILTNPLVSGCFGSGSVAYGPLAVGSRWLAYSGNPVVTLSSGRVSPQHLTPSASFPSTTSNGSLVAHYAKESSKQLAAGIVTLGDMGYKKLSRYCSELLPDSNSSIPSGSTGWKVNGTNGHLPDADSVGMVIVRDIVSKSAIAQFRAHKSPISALCFDPSGTLLVTASVQGHNINVFRIMPVLPGNSSGTDAGASYVHLYRLQRGLTNAVIQDISFSDDSSWVMISSLRGTSHLFAISPFGGPLIVQSAEASFSAKTIGTVSTKAGVCPPPSSGLQFLSQQNLCPPGPPITLSAVSRIRSGNNGWKGTVSGAAAAATGRLGVFSGPIASSFHTCRSDNVFMDSTPLNSKYHLLVYTPSGCIIQYALRLSMGLDSVAVGSVPGAAYESAVECDGRIIVEAIQKWNIFQKQNRRDREDNIDIYGENGAVDSHKIFPEGIEKERIVSPLARGLVSKEVIIPEDRHHLHISEAELQMHQPRMPLWAKSEIYFQAMTVAGVEHVEDSGIGGEVEIERISTRAIEARSKDLVPVCDYLQSPKVHHLRIAALDRNVNGRLVRQKSGMSEQCRLSRRGSSGSLESMTEASVVMPENQNGTEEKIEWAGLRMPAETTKGIVNKSGSPSANIRLGIVNNRESLKMEGHFKYVNNSNGGLTNEKQFEDHNDEFD